MSTQLPAVEWFEGSRDELADLFAQADDSPAALSAYRDLGRVLVATHGPAVIGHLQLVAGDSAGAAEVKSIAVREDRQGTGIGRMLLERAVAACRHEGRSSSLSRPRRPMSGCSASISGSGFACCASSATRSHPRPGYPGDRDRRDPVTRPRLAVAVPGRGRDAQGPMTRATDDDLYLRGSETLLASWAQYARGSAGAALQRLSGVAAAVFPKGPERAVYNNALLDRDLGRTERAAAVDAMVAAYRSAGIERYAAWVHESDEGMRAELSGRGYTIAESTLAMGMSLDATSLARPEVELGRLEWPEYLEYLQIVGMPAGLLSGADPSAFHTLVARRAGESVATAIALDHHGDCGIYNMSTLEPARRRGLGTALTARHVHDAAERGCATASLQSTAMAERVYAAVGFRDLGRILEYVP